MAFQTAELVAVSKIRNKAGAVIEISILYRLHDDAISETLTVLYIVTGDEFASLPSGALAKKAALIAIIKREARDQYLAWKAQIADRPKAPVVGDPLTDLGLVEITDFIGAAPPLAPTAPPLTGPVGELK